MYGTAYSGTRFGTTMANTTEFIGSGASLTAMNLGNVTNVPLVLGINNIDRFRIASTETVFNETGSSSYDLRVEGDTDANLLMVDASADNVGIGIAAPLGKLHVEKNHNGRTFTLLTNSTVGTDATVEIAAASGALGVTDVSGGFAAVPTTYTNALFGGTISAGRGIVYNGGTVTTGLTIAGRLGDIRFYAGSEIATTGEVARMSTSESVFNEQAQSRNFRVEGQTTRPNLLLIDAVNSNRVGINRTAGTLAATLDIDNLTVDEPILLARHNTAEVFSITQSGYLRVAELPASATPSSGFGIVYAKTDGALYWINDSGQEWNLLAQTVVRTITTNTTLAITDNTILADATSGNITVTLPLATAKKEYKIKKIDSSANTVTVARTSTDTIDGATSFVITDQYEAYSFISDGTTLWNIW
jgi:hypothetical protein